ncbi:hypothetical protein ABET11_26990 [Priestia megaterium]|uniref:hypothetical protein n=1 Tax=Priestia megaterium TaxID=1404 RepID=UPI000BF25314|nr:hypothetical protein [Priestia megaterium]MED4761228.1 hypothetical protein [Priestia megaterium]PEW13291.1 hypothetical protein CN435_23330 [Priestia megaterium]PEZ49900.1 hypothetical protein CN367_03210 [Priestia megaterium]PFL60142.1 hypothetical protein COJ36_28155 [Priestia megaterium]PFP14329.1 hypothetical protein COJ92_23815 [Priestia megaterium]
MTKKISKKQFKKIQQSFACFFEDEDNQLELFNTLVKHAAETMPGVDVTNPSALLDVAAETPAEDSGFALIILLFIFLIILSG